MVELEAECEQPPPEGSAALQASSLFLRKQDAPGGGEMVTTSIHSSVTETVHPALLDQSRKAMNVVGGNTHLPHPHTRSRVLPPVAELIQPLRWISHASLDASDVGAGTGRRPHLFQEDSSPGRLWRRVLRSREWRRKVVINFKLKDFFLCGWLSLWRLFRWDGD